ncbi:MAG: hypothetical protein ACOYN2_03280 [Patescibacteria group bacterium]
MKDGKESAPYDYISSFEALSGGRTVFLARKNGATMIVDNGKEYPYGFPSWNITVSPDKKGYAVAVKRIGSETSTVFADGKELTGDYSFTDSPSYTPDGRIVYFANSKNKTYLMIDGKVVSKGYALANPSSLTFSSDGKHFAFSPKNSQ